MAADRLPPIIEHSVRAAISSALQDADRHMMISPAGSLIVHISRVYGEGGSFVALLIERESRRAPLASAARRFELTKREREVLELILRGMHASDIADKLTISQSTVTGYFKGLLRKTRSKSRTEMVAKVLEWDGGDREALSGTGIEGNAGTEDPRPGQAIR